MSNLSVVYLYLECTLLLVISLDILHVRKIVELFIFSTYAQGDPDDTAPTVRRICFGNVPKEIKVAAVDVLVDLADAGNEVIFTCCSNAEAT